MQTLTFSKVAKRFGRAVALHPITLEVKAGEFLTLLGPSGSGKSTLLNIAAGHVAASSGRVIIGDRDVTALPARRRNIGMVFQSYALFPHLNVFENVAYGLRARRMPRAEIGRRVAEALATVQLDGFDRRRVQELSGGQEQRVALARALAIAPDVLLLDEPLSALDRQLRKRLQLEIRRLHERVGRTMLYVTHDQEEALVMSDRIAILRDGALEQLGTARELYRCPRNAFVAGFLGESNLIEGRVSGVSSGVAELAVESLGLTIRGAAAPDIAVGAAAAALIRPEAVRFGSRPGLPARLEETVYLGDIVAARFRLGNRQEIWCRQFATTAELAEESGLAWSDDEVRILPLQPPVSQQGG